jgi:hypothetical protein
MTTHDWLDGFRGLICMVERNCADVVMKDVGFNDTVEESAADETEFTIDCCSSSTNIVPASGRVVRKRWVGVLEIGDSNWGSLVNRLISFSKDIHTKPVVHPEVRGKVPDRHVGETVGFAKHGEDTDSDYKTEITEKDEFGVLGFVKRAFWVEVVDACGKPVNHTLSATFMLTLVVVVASYIPKEIHWPSYKLLSEGVKKGCNGSLFGQLVKFVNEFSDTVGICLASLGNEDHITLHVSSSLVMLAVGDLPRKVWDKKC